jgi:hypothetical protein
MTIFEIAVLMNAFARFIAALAESATVIRRRRR